MNATLSGAVCIRNGNELDYCWREAVKSLLPVCDEVVICDGESTDGTQEEIREWLKREPKLNLCVYPWPNPKGDPEFWVKWLNYAREHARYRYHFQLDADEILHEESYPAIREFLARPDLKDQTIRIHRLNFWRDPQHLIPEGHCCGARVIRVAPATMWLPSDGSTGNPLEGIPPAHAFDDYRIRIFHYGFMRRSQAFFRKAKAIQGYFFDTYDPRLANAENQPGNWMEIPGITGWENSLTDFSGQHPALGVEWLASHDYKLD